MANLKTYSWKGTGSMTLRLPIDGKKVEIIFPTGSERPKINAQYETEDEKIQEAIQKTGLFKKGFIRIISEKDVVKNTVGKNDNSGGSPNKGKFTSVLTLQQAAEKLHEKFEIPMEELNSPDAIMSKAASVGASFPNLKY